MCRIPALLALVVVVGCGGSDSDNSSIPPDAAALQNYEKTGVTLTIPRLSGLEGRLPFLLSLGTPGADGLVFQVDLSPGAPPNSYDFTIPIDGDHNGIPEVTLDGHATFNDDPANAGIGFGGHLVFTMDMVGGLGNFSGDMDFTLASGGEREISGTGTFTENITGNSTSLVVDPSSPITMKAATGSSTSMANACAYSLDGPANLEITGSQGTLASTWNFSNTSRSVAVTGASFTSGTTTTPLPDRNVTIPCGGNGVISDWAGVFLQNWACFPPEFGQATLTLAVSGSNTIGITDEDPPGSGQTASYSATVIPGNPHVLRGFFIGGPPGNTYREDFSWTLAANGNSFSQISYYVYQEGPSIGTGGLCGGQAVRQP